MRTHTFKLKILLMTALYIAVPVLMLGIARAEDSDAQKPRPIILTEPKESLEDRLARKITLDVRDMNIVDILKFLAVKGDFNVVISPTVEGKTTVLLHNVGIKDAMDIVVISNKLAYHIENDIVQMMTAAEFESIYGKKFSDKQKQVYSTIGGTPGLDREYTVYGEVIQGLDVIDKIAAVKCGNADRPIENVIMKIKIINN